MWKSLTNILLQDRIRRLKALSDLCRHDRLSQDLIGGR